jgi:hypothetical protein
MKIVQAFLVSSSFVFITVASGQATAKPGSDWSRVQALPPGTTLHVKAVKNGGLCHLKSTSAEGLICEGTGGKSFHPVSDIRAVQIAHRGRSAAILGAVGAGVGVGVVAASSKAIGFGGGAKGAVFAGGVGLGALVFAPIGFFSDAFRGETIYSAP